jgi:hypothetical protein
MPQTNVDVPARAEVYALYHKGLAVRPTVKDHTEGCIGARCEERALGQAFVGERLPIKLDDLL